MLSDAVKPAVAQLVLAASKGNDAKVKRLLKANVDACGHGWSWPPHRGWRARARDAAAFKGGMTVKEINAAFGERAGELKKPAKRLGLIDMGLIHLFMM